MTESESKKKEEVAESDSTAENDSLYSQESAYKQKDDSTLRGQLTRMSNEDLLRYESFRGSNLPKTTMKKFISSVIGQAVNPNIIIGMCGLSKVFVGEMVREAKKAQSAAGDTGPLLPAHIHEAYRRLYRKMPNMKVFKKEPWNN
ncbi:transcription initiation factor TFIID subunit 11 [Pancytospora epiphaga]|nr:transcription initiation factor TFIID subunit 11 [Pancytospora epiphaga]